MSDYKKIQSNYKKEYGEKYKRYILEEVKNKYCKLVEYKVIENGSRYDKIQMVFTREDGTYSGKDIIKYPFKIIHHELGINCKFYDLRGSFATISLRNGSEIKDISEILGHSKIETTENYYINCTKDNLKDVCTKFEKEINNDISIKYLNEFERHASYNKNEIGHSRPYLGIVIKVEDYEYFVPLYSYKEYYKKYKNNASFFFVYDRNERPLAIIKFSAMIPVLKGMEVIKLLEYNEQDAKYKALISAKYRYINSHKEEIYKRAEKMYMYVIKHKNNYLKNIACDFKLLEEKSKEYKNNNENIFYIC